MTGKRVNGRNLHVCDSHKKKENIMEEKVLSEKESLQLITQMIRTTQDGMQQRGTEMLLWGYLTVICSAVVSAACILTGNPEWNWLWFAIPVIGFPASYLMCRGRQKPVTTYIDRVIAVVWQVIGLMLIGCTLTVGFMRTAAFMMPIALISVAVGATITYAVLRNKVLAVFGGIGIFLGYLLFGNLLANGGCPYIWDVVVFAAGFICVCIVPGHILNSKCRKS